MYRDLRVLNVVHDSYTRLCGVGLRELVFALERCKLVFEQTRLNLRNTGGKNSLETMVISALKNLFNSLLLYKDLLKHELFIVCYASVT